MAYENRKKVVILATGGTIAGVGTEGKSVGYEPGALDVSKLIESVPLLDQAADIEAMQICSVNSDDMTAEIWLNLATSIQRVAERFDVDGIVVTHGTDTMDETAYFLNLVLKTNKPVVLTGSMRPSTATSADGPMNLYQAVVVAADPASAGKGVLVQFSGRIYSARAVQKSSTHSVTTMDGGESGSCGIVRDDAVLYSSQSTKPHTLASEFSVYGLGTLPKVNVLYFNIDADPRMIKAVAEFSDGLIIAGAGAGEFSKLWAEALEEIDIPVVISSRVGSGVIMQENSMITKGIAGNDLPPQKAAILLRLALTRTSDRNELMRIFKVY